jgi:hypothetical protein
MNAKIQPPPYRAGHYPWDQWEQTAMERGMERTLAQLGRDVIRDADQHNWAPPLRQLCEGLSLVELLIRSPYLGRRLCEILLETDGLRIAYTEDDKQNVDLIRLAGFGGLY